MKLYKAKYISNKIVGVVNTCHISCENKKAVTDILAKIWFSLDFEKKTSKTHNIKLVQVWNQCNPILMKE